MTTKILNAVQAFEKKQKQKKLKFIILFMKFKIYGQAELNNSLFLYAVNFQRFYQWTLVSSFFVITSNPAKVPFRTTGSDLHIYGKQRLARRNWQPHHCNII